MTPRTGSLSRRTVVAGIAAGIAAHRTFADGFAQTGALEVIEEADVPFGEVSGVTLLLAAYRPPERAEPRPAVILIHGGGWFTGGYYDLSENGYELAKLGYVAFCISYRLMGGGATEDKWPAQIDDVQRAVRWVRANAEAYNVDPERIGSLGFSAGGHLAAHLGVRDTNDNSDPELADYSSKVKCVVDIAGVNDLSIKYPYEGDQQIVTDLLGGTEDEVPDAYKDASPIEWVDADTSPFLLIHGPDDTTLSVEHSRHMFAALEEAGVEVVYEETPGVDHGDFVPWAFSGPATSAFLEKHLTPEV